MLIKVVDHFKKTNSLRREYRGIVVDNADPRHIGRIKVTIDGFMEGVTASLPWIHQKAPAMLGGRSDMSSFAAPDIGTEVVVEFPYDDVYSGFYTGFWQSEATHPYFLDEDYPASYGFRDTQGTQLRINRAKKLMEFIHASGMSWTVTSDSSSTFQSASIMTFMAEDNATYLRFDMETGDINLVAKDVLELNAQTLNITANDVIETVNSKTSTISGAMVEQVYGGKKLIVGGSESISIVGNVAHTIAANKTELIAGTSDTTHGQTKSETVVLGNIETLLLSGDRTIDITLGNHTVTLLAGNYTANVTAGGITLTTAAGAVEISNSVGKHIVSAGGLVESSNSLGKHSVSASGIVESSNSLGGITVDASGKVSITSTLDTEITATVDFVVNATVNATINATTKASISAPLIVLGAQVGNVLTTITAPIVDTLTGAPHLGVPTIFAG